MCCSYIKGLLGGPTPAEHEALTQERDDLKQQLSTMKQQLEDLQGKVHCLIRDCFPSNKSGNSYWCS